MSTVEPIAIVGMACRLPGARTPEELWSLMMEGRDALQEVPSERWQAQVGADPEFLESGQALHGQGGFIEWPFDFDPAFFGLSPSEAKHMDPQQRIALELAWHALERAGIDPRSIAGTETSVHLGVGSADYREVYFSDAQRINAYYAAGNASCMIPNRISNFFDLRGASIAVDSGCSASLIAVHLACEGLRAGDAELALAGGVQLVLSEHGAIGLAQAWMIASDGKCRSFDADASGFVRGEGCAMVVLKRLSDALRAGDSVLALILGSAVNQAGGSGQSPTSPSSEAQAAVVHKALRRAGLSPAAIDYVEAHGVGTHGDVVECQALSTVFAEPERALMIGSVKPYLGHLEPASGIASLLRAVLVLRHGVVPPHPHFERLHPEIATLPVKFTVATAPTAIARRFDEPLRVGVNAFGLGGTNVHVVLSEPVEAPRSAVVALNPQLFALSARDEGALERLRDGYLSSSLWQRASLPELAFSACVGRAHEAQRIAIVAPSLAELRAALAQGRDSGAASYHARAPESPRYERVLYLPHDATPWLSLAWLAEPAVASRLEPLRSPFAARFGCSLDDVLSSPAAHGPDARATAAASLQWALARQLMDGGFTPFACAGHGLGGVIAGALATSPASSALIEQLAAALHTAPGLSLWIRGEAGFDALASPEALRAALDDRGVELLVVGLRDSGVSELGLSGAVRELDGGDLEQTRARLLRLFADVYVEGSDLRWQAIFASAPAPRVMLPCYPFERVRCVLDRPQPEASAPLALDTGLTSALNAAPARRRSALAAWLRGVLREVAGDEICAAMRAGATLVTAGGTSLQALALRNRLAAALRERCELPATLLFEQPTLDALTESLCASLWPRETESFAGRELVRHALAPDEPIAIIGVGCRLPGGIEGPEDFWSLLEHAGNTVSRIPGERWDVDAYFDEDPERAGFSYARFGHFVKDVDRFDADFFGLSPREATKMDPQHRLLLEVAWHALEDAGYAPRAARGKAYGVFIGVLGNEYLQRQLMQGDRGAIDTYYGTGNIGSAAAGRISYHLGLRGPAVVFDTACSSSLLSVHYAAESLRRGECEVALAGGVNLMLTPEPFLFLSRSHAISSDGQCKTFAANADGYGRGEGCGLVVLKPLSRAQADGDRVLALIRGSAVNHDGAAAGFTVPSLEAQEQVIDDALARARVRADEVGYVEAHGTGTPLGDPIELRALGSRYGARRAQALWVGSVKTNIGHLESAAGIAALIKVALSLHHGVIPAHLHAEEETKLCDLSQMQLRIPHHATPWPVGPAGRLAGISAFGMSGTNVHMLLEAAPPSSGDTSATASLCRVETPAEILTLSAKSPAALRELTLRYADALERMQPDQLAPACALSRYGRSHHARRLACVARQPVEAARALRQRLNEASAVARVREAGPAFLFTGQGSQYPAMARSLYAEEPVFRRELERCATVLDGLLEVPLVSLLCDPVHGERIQQTRYAQPALFAFEWGLACVWQSLGVVPSLVMGHSVGEYVAACVAGVLRLDDGLRLIEARGRLMQALPIGGAMAAVFADEATVAMLAAEFQLDIAAINGPEEVVVAGARERVEQVLAAAARRGLQHRRLSVSHAFHSALMDPMMDALAVYAQDIALSEPVLPWVSNLTGALVTRELLSARYFVEHVRQPVQFARGIARARALGCDLFLELGPKAVLSGMGMRCTSEAQFVASQRADRDPALALQEATARLYELGVDIDWSAHRPAPPDMRQRSLPRYPFDRQSYWIGSAQRSPLQGAERWLHAVAWEDADEGDSARLATSLLIGDPLSREGLAQSLRAQGVRVQTATTVASARDALREGDFALVIFALGTGVGEAAAERAAADVLSLAQQLARASSPARLAVVTAGAVCVHAGEHVEPTQASAWGIGRVIALELPERWLRVVDLPVAPTEEDYRFAARALGHEGEGNLAIRAGRILGERLTRTPLPPSGEAKVDAQASYLISGGLGALGASLAEWLALRGAGALYLLGRSAPSRAQEQQLERLRGFGTAIHYLRVDVGDEAALEKLLAEVTQTGLPLKGVFHAAGVLRDASLLKQSESDLHTVMRAKCGAAWTLDRATRKLSLDHFVLFSSLASVVGNRGQANYAAANAVLDAIAQRRRADGLPALSVNWGPWDGGGMAHAAALEGRRAELGVSLIPPALGLQLLDRLLAEGGLPQQAVLPIDWSRFVAHLPRSVAGSLLRRLAEPTLGAVPEPMLELRELDPAARHARVESFLLQLVRRVLGVAPTRALDLEQGFFEMGMDSLMTVEVKNRIAEATGLTLSQTFAFNYPNIAALTHYLCEESMPPEAQPALPDEDPLSCLLARIEHMEDREVDALLEAPRRSA